MRKLGAWTFERAMEVSMASIILINHDAISRKVGVLEEFYLTANLTLVFYFFTGYMASCIYFGYLNRSEKSAIFAAIMGLAFSGHVVVFFALSHAGFDRELALIFFQTLIGVVTIHFLSDRWWFRHHNIWR